MKFRSVIHVAGKPYESYQADHVATLEERVFMIHLFRAIHTGFNRGLTLPQKLMFWSKITLFLLNPKSKPYFYRPVEEQHK